MLMVLRSPTPLDGYPGVGYSYFLCSNKTIETGDSMTKKEDFGVKKPQNLCLPSGSLVFTKT